MLGVPVRKRRLYYLHVPYIGNRICHGIPPNSSYNLSEIPRYLELKVATTPDILVLRVCVCVCVCVCYR